MHINLLDCVIANDCKQQMYGISEFIADTIHNKVEN